MPNESDRAEVCLTLIIYPPKYPHWHTLTYVPLPQILEAASRKLNVSSNVDWGEIARATVGFSGADLQALLYNAHLAVVNAHIANEEQGSKGKGKNASGNGEDGEHEEDDDDERPIEYTILGGPPNERVKTRAEEMDLQRRVSEIGIPLPARMDDSLYFMELKQIRVASKPQKIPQKSRAGPTTKVSSLFLQSSRADVPHGS
jgi:SpoVK/Ycf46/Vps4 family AAA+-type ATPase